MEPALPSAISSSAESLNPGTFGHDRRDSPQWVSLLILIAATIAMLVPFLDKPFHIDDPLFVWSAKHIRENLREGRNPGDFFGFDINWNGVVQPMYGVTQNPPLACYAIAAGSYITGWDERGLHALFLLPAIGTVLGTWILAKRLCQRPVFAGLVVVCSPVFIVSSTNVMCDTLMSCLWMWAIVLWVAGLDRGSSWRLALSAVLISLSALTKYFGLCLLPLLTLYTLARSFRSAPRLLWLLIPVLCMWGYNEWTRRLYGLESGMLTGAANYARLYYRHKSTQHESIKPVATFAFAGGCMLCFLFYVPALLRRIWWSAIGLGIAVGIGYWLHLRDFRYLQPDLVRPTSWDLALQAGLLDVLGLVVCGLILVDLWQTWRDSRGSRGTPAAREALAGSLLLGAWVGGTLLFTGYVNWTVNGRSVLPMIPAAAILMSRRMDVVSRSALPSARGVWNVFRPLRRAWIALYKAPASRWQFLPLLPAAILTLLIAHSDYLFAWNQRRAAEEISNIARNMRGFEFEPGKLRPRRLWYAGHWGYQYYMDQIGVGKAIAYKGPRLKKGDLFALPKENAVQSTPSPDDADARTFLRYESSPWVGVHCRTRRAGFYADRWGPLPFAFGDEWQPDPKLAAQTYNIHLDQHYLLEISRDLATDGLLGEEDTGSKDE